MASLIENREKFFEDYNIDKEDFNNTGLQWDDLIQIYKDYLNYKEELETAGETIAKILRSNSLAHSVRMRIKEPEHLIEKLIRKKIKNKKFKFNLNDYKEIITDLIGLRVLHIFKKDAEEIDNFIRKHWLPREAKIYFREGDYIRPELEQRFVCEKHENSYRSWHYLINIKLTELNTYTAEIQVRTIFEEGWSEIDHKLRYPYNLDNEILNSQLQVLNRLAGSADEMVNSINETLLKYKKMFEEQQEKDKELIELRKTVEQMDLESKQSEALLGKIDSIESKPKSDYALTASDLQNVSNYIKNILIGG
ncbi:hypothetical protein MOC76_12525 [Bacillus spizizenii]|nr:hypothetical protein [Bacillus spizizenii]MCY9244024.1 hypothetical protein [Bacillus spizizenii]MCY9326444.1 hypothetical protein [Bacillus spizizenii]